MNLSVCETSSLTSWWHGFVSPTSLSNSTTLKTWRPWGTSLARLS
ncbi:hypothetical protein LINPERHAP1_LOCUS36804 [Linum perenne]